MKIGFTCPISLKMIADLVDNSDEVPEGYRFPMTALLARELHNRGHHIIVFALDPSINSPQIFHGNRFKIHVGRYRIRVVNRVRDFFKLEIGDLRRAMRSESCDMIHALWTYEYALAALTAHQKVLVTAQDAPLSVIRYLPHPYRIYRLFMALRVLQKTNHFTAVSPYVENQFKRWLRYSRSIQVIPNAVADDQISTNSSRSKPSDIVTFASLGGWDKRKNPKCALTAFYQTKHALPNSKLIMFGPEMGSSGKAKSWAIENGFDRGVEFAGKTDHESMIHRLKTEADVFLHTSLEDACSVAVLEGMACGLPVIGGRNSGGVAWQLDNGRAGELTDVRNPSAVAESMIRLGSDVNLRNQFVQHSLSRVTEKFTMSSVVDQYEDQYRRIVEKEDI